MLSFSLKFQSSELLFTYNHHSLASLFVLFKHKSLTFVNLSLLSLLFLHISIFWLEHLYILPKLQRPAWKKHILWCITDIHGWNLSEKVCLMRDDSFPVPLLCSLKYISIYFIHNSMKSSCRKNCWMKSSCMKSWFPSELVMFLKIDPRCLGQFGKFQDTREISM